MKVLVADKLEEEALAGLRALPGVEVVSAPGVSRDELPGALGGVNVLVVRSKEVSAQAMEAGTSLALVVRAGAGVNTIDVKAASARGVSVANCPGKNAIAVAELAIGFMLAADRRIPEANRSLREGRWEKSEFGKADGLYGKTVGIAGLGAIGRETALRARALGLKVHGWSRSLTEEQASDLGVTRHASLLSLARASEILSLHLALKPETRGVVDENILEALPRGALLVNTARAEVLDWDAVIRFVRDRGLRLATDVFPGEPEGGRGTYTHELLGMAGVWGTPHIGASTAQAQLAIAAETVRIVKAFLETGEAPNCVNVLAQAPARAQVVVRHRDRVGVLASVLEVLKRHGINVGEMTNRLFAGGAAATARIRLASRPEDGCMAELSALPDVLHAERIELG
ncbi:MAG: hypothetical protein HY909_19945 [Deltaproteobacteria bacterium]|nr:hypothetical protein [Deltaproteobacteria bacterium]